MPDNILGQAANIITRNGPGEFGHAWTVCSPKVQVSKSIGRYGVRRKTTAWKEDQLSMNSSRRRDKGAVLRESDEMTSRNK